ncbi:hypothetical protein AAFF_G00125630 [Aldrovandia affinis]|uniref:Uncharacterized protein n=1 Tax=Aldrovandia affinis TaxID=143900 RepID=A0AAD7RRQ2_9TELE|nr:hypothetical protein AAFF_G00125630 [Aldrovandia affinis]
MTAGPARAKLYACSDHSRRTLRQLPLGPGQFSCPAAEQAPERRRQMSKAALRWDHPHTHMETSWHSHQPSSGALQHSQAAVQPSQAGRPWFSALLSLLEGDPCGSSYRHDRLSQLGGRI